MNKIIDIIRKFICLFLSIILFFLIGFYLVLDLSPKIIVKDNIKILANELTTEELIYNGENTPIDSLEKILIENNLDVSVISGILNQDNFKEIITKYYGELVEAIIYNKTVPQLNSVEIVDVLKQNFKNSLDDLGIIISEDEQKLIIEYLNIHSERIIEIVPTYDQVIEMIGVENVDSLRALFGSGIKILLILIMILIVIFIALVSWSIYKFAIWSGATTIVASLTIMILSSLLYDIVLNYTNLIISTPVKNLVENNILKTVTTTGTTAIAIGAVQILYYFILRKKTTSPKY